MQIKNISRAELDTALSHVNSIYGGNIMYNDLQPFGSGFKVRLRVADSKKFGARVSHSGRRLISASWQVHRDFMSFLFDNYDSVKIYSAYARYNSKADFYDKFEATYYTNIGSNFSPLYIGASSVNEDGSKPF